MTHGEKAGALFLEAYNCAQSVVLAFADEMGIPKGDGGTDRLVLWRRPGTAPGGVAASAAWPLWRESFWDIPGRRDQRQKRKGRPLCADPGAGGGVEREEAAWTAAKIWPQPGMAEWNQLHNALPADRSQLRGRRGFPKHQITRKMIHAIWKQRWTWGSYWRSGYRSLSWGTYLVCATLRIIQMYADMGSPAVERRESPMR